jgi:hypothetical protein
MERAEGTPPARLLRLFLYGLGVAGGLLLLGFAFGSPSASADEPSSPSSGPGLLGPVGSLIDAATAPVSDTLDTTVSGTVDPLAQAVPTPLQLAARSGTDAVTDVTPPVAVAQALTPAIGAADQLVGSLPVVGGTLSSTLGPLSGVTAPVVSVVDDAVAEVAGAFFGPAMPSQAAGIPSAEPSEAMSAATGSASSMAGSWADATTYDRQAPGTGSTSARPATPLSPGAPPGVPGGTATAPGSGADGSGGGTAVSAVIDATAFGMPAGSVTGAASDDRLPSTPAFDTDSTPD